MDELRDYSGCSEHVEKRGNLVNKDTIFKVTGNLIKETGVPVSETLCNRKTKNKIINIHIPFLRFSEAALACNKFHTGSIVGPFQVDFYFLEN